LRIAKIECGVIGLCDVQAELGRAVAKVIANAACRASKGAVRIFSNSATTQYAKCDDQIRVNSIHPGFVDTRMDAMPLGASSSRSISPRAACILHPLMRPG
jgi:NAD(P)-dependent dehydrogenase (short-subunit alcohol dehydrogenase family)